MRNGVRALVIVFLVALTVPLVVAQNTGTCGNAIVERGEQCDVTRDGKGSACPAPAVCSKCQCIDTCGDGVLDFGEQCEYDSDCVDGVCWGCGCWPAEPVKAGCGNAWMDPGEECEPSVFGAVCPSGQDCLQCKCGTPPGQPPLPEVQEGVGIGSVGPSGEPVIYTPSGGGVEGSSGVPTIPTQEGSFAQMGGLSGSGDGGTFQSELSVSPKLSFGKAVATSGGAGVSFDLVGWLQVLLLLMVVLLLWQWHARLRP